jgi:hypothetical protein
MEINYHSIAGKEQVGDAWEVLMLRSDLVPEIAQAVQLVPQMPTQN